MKMKVKVFNHYDEISQKAAEEIITQVKTNPGSTLGLATGSSPIGLYQFLIKDFQESNTSYKHVKTFNLDEYYGIAKTHQQSYYKFMWDNLFSHIDIQEENVHIPNGQEHNIEQECNSYNKKLSGAEIDIQILGIGSNGHIGFNEPGTPFDSVTHKVALDEKTRLDNARFFNAIDEVPKYAISMGIKNILQAKKIILIATGIKKAHAIKAMVQGPIDPSCPASALQTHENVLVLVDQEAASLL
jgi:glucosamine-6-phosphate deaminase